MAKSENLKSAHYPVSGNQVDHLQEKKEFITENYPIELVEAKISFPLKAEDNQDLDEKISSLIHKVDGIWTCTVCGKSDKLSNNIKKHAEIHIEGVGRPCGQCGKMLKSRNSLQVHMSRNHSVK